MIVIMIMIMIIVVPIIFIVIYYSNYLKVSGEHIMGYLETQLGNIKNVS
jgi:hypothetical protein